MDGDNNGKPYEQIDDLGGPPLFLETPIYIRNETPLGPAQGGQRRLWKFQPKAAPRL